LGYLASAPSEALTGKLQYLGKFEDLTEISRGTVVDRVFLAMRGYSDQRHHTLLSRLEKCAQLKIPVLIISHVFNDFNFSLTLDGYSGIFAVDRRIPIYSKLHNRMLKRAMDIVVSLLLILISFPVWLVIILFIKLFDHGPIFYRSPRVGKGGGQFVALKFRTMMANADEILKNNLELQEKYRKNIKIDYDPRITTVGKWLRKFSLDEIPQIINVLKGDMSLVGPRPALLDEVDLIGDFIHMRNLIRPGLTGFWQVSGRNKTTYEERIQMDKFYINNWSIWMDLVILLKTPIIVLFGHGAM
jgi:undecaprenyl-phosphate galactose phosphotransferase